MGASITYINNLSVTCAYLMLKSPFMKELILFPFSKNSHFFKNILFTVSWHSYIFVPVYKNSNGYGLMSKQTLDISLYSFSSEFL